MNGSSSDETILICVDYRSYALLQSICQNFGDQLYLGVEQGDGPKIIDPSCISHFRNEGDIRGVNTFDANQVVTEPIAKVIEILFNGWPTFLYELIIKDIWPRRLIVWEGFDNIVNLFMRELLFKVSKVITTLDERGWVSIDEVRVRFT
jgi:hypothetical protein